jgi:hypothetical protein
MPKANPRIACFELAPGSGTGGCPRLDKSEVVIAPLLSRTTSSICPGVMGSAGVPLRTIGSALWARPIEGTVNSGVAPMPLSSDLRRISDSLYQWWYFISFGFYLYLIITYIFFILYKL